jgi:hypothetical protein
MITTQAPIMAAGARTRVQLSATQLLVSWLKYQIIPGYAGKAFVGDSLVDDTRYGWEWEGGDADEVVSKIAPAVDVSEIWIFFDQGGGGVTWGAK